MIGVADHPAQKVRTTKSVRWANPFEGIWAQTVYASHTRCARMRLAA